MALLYFDGFDHYGAADGRPAVLDPAHWSESGGSSNDDRELRTMPVLSGLGLWQSYDFASDEGQRLLLPRVPLSGETWGFGFHMYMTALPSSNASILGFAAGAAATTRCLRVGSGGVLSWSTALGGSDLGNSGSNVLTNSVLYHIEMKVLFHASAGTVEVRVNGVPYMSLTGVATLPTSATHLKFAQLTSTGTTTQGIHYDNLYIWDSTGSLNNDWLGERIVYTLMPDADTAQEDWARSSGSDSYNLVNDIPQNGGSNYLETDAIDDQTTLGLANLPSNNVAVLAVQTRVVAQKTAAGSAVMRHGIVSDGNEALSDDFNLTNGSFLYDYHVFETDPDGSIPWTASAVNALEVTIKRTN